MAAFALSCAIVFVAELGDKSQLMALAFATRFPAWLVLIGITLATAVTLGLSVAIGALASEHLPTTAITVAAGVAFLGFAVWTYRGDDSEAGNAGPTTDGRRGAVATVAAVGATFFLAELGDKTMLATITLAATNGALGTWLGSTVGMVAADALAIVVGRQLGRRLPGRVVRTGAAVTFAAVGLVLIIDAL